MTETNDFQPSEPGAFSDPLTEVLRNGARALLAQAVEAEVAILLGRHARAYGAEAIETLASIMRSAEAPASARSAAAQAVLDRGYGRPLQSIRHGGEEDAAPIRIESLSEYQLEVLIARLSKS